MKFEEYFDRVNKAHRKSGVCRRIGVKSILGNPNLDIPTTSNKKEDQKRRYKELGEKFTAKQIK